MIGIDIIDLKDPLLQSRNKRSLDLIAHPEDGLIEHPHLFWLLWTAKEAVFKQKRQDVSFKPKHIPISLLVDKDQRSFKSEAISGFFEIASDYVLAVAYGDTKSPTFKIHKIEEGANRENIRILFSKSLASSQRLGSDELGLPIILPGKIQVTFSHHGQYAAYAY